MTDLSITEAASPKGEKDAALTGFDDTLAIDEIPLHSELSEEESSLDTPKYDELCYKNTSLFER